MAVSHCHDCRWAFSLYLDLNQTNHEGRDLTEENNESQSDTELEGFESWDAGGSDCYFYVQDSEFARMLYRDFGPGAAYFCGGRLVARQFRLPKRLLSLLIKRHQSHLSQEIDRRKGAIDCKRLTAVRENKSEICVDKTATRYSAEGKRISHLQSESLQSLPVET